MDTTILRSNLNSARMTCGWPRGRNRDLMTAASLTGERVNLSTHNPQRKGAGAVCRRELLRRPRM